MRRLIFSEGEFYHLYNRGVDKRTVFTSATEYRRFLAYLYLLNSTDAVRADSLFIRTGLEDILTYERGTPLVAIGCFCLMPNHFHILATPLIENGISKFMQRLQTAYTMYFNEKHKRSGSLFQGTYKARHAQRDEYLKYLFAYIHLNPAKLADPQWKERSRRDLRGLYEQVGTYPYSSIREYHSSRFVISDPKPFPEYFATTRDFDTYVSHWMEYKDEAEKWKV